MKSTECPRSHEPTKVYKVQFSVRFLLITITLAAFLLGLAVQWGAAVTLIPLAVLVAAGNRAGSCRAVQQGRVQLVLGGLAWFAFVTSFFLPAVTVPPEGEAAPGWQAAWYVYMVNYDLLTGGLLSSPWTSAHLFRALLFLAVGAANLLLAWMPVALFVKRGRSAWFVALLLASVSVFGFSLDRYAHYGSGYILWAVSFMVVSSAFPIGRRLFSVYIGLMSAMVTWILIGQMA